MKIKSLKRIKERYRESPLWVSVIEYENGEREEVAGKTLKSVLLTLHQKTGAFNKGVIA